MSNDYRNNTPLERTQMALKAEQDDYKLRGGTVLGAGNKSRDNMADVIIARELDALICLASQVEESAQRRLMPVSFGFPTSPEEPSKHQQLPLLFSSYYERIERVRESLKRIQEFIASVQISEP